MNKKSSIMIYLILAAWIGSVAWALLQATKTAPEVKPQLTYVGEAALSVYSNENEAYTKLAYIQSASHFSVQLALKELPERLGICQAYGTYAILYKEKSCLPAKTQIDTILKQTFMTSFNQRLNQNKDIAIKAENYEYSVVNKGHLIFLGIATSALQSDLSLEPKTTVSIRQEPEITDLPDMIPFSCAAESQQYICKLKPEAYKRLQKAQQEAQQAGHELIVNSAYRSREEQEKLCGGKTREGKCSNPLAAASESSAHLTGGAVDVRLKFKGIRQACGTVSSYRGMLNDYNNAKDPNGIQINDCRKELNRIMTSVGFVNLANEWWHWEYGTPLWAKEESKSMNAEVKPLYIIT
ncbi:D-alanyl-D-alanine carboxypeptidase family protein [Candidatus Woesearchaeota archaeon]|nr:D-alanyl-D-alanine carboxypeptidase family protein [Candidatus Woesearchaeota archaeon]